MRRAVRRILTTGAMLATVAGLAGAGCADNNESLYVIYNGKPDQACNVTASESGTGLSGGALDLVVGSSYMLHPIIRNAMPSSLAVNQFTETDGRLEAHNVYLKEAVVSYDLEAFQMSYGPVHIDLSGTVMAGGLAMVDVMVIQPDLAARLDAKLAPRSVDEPRPSKSLLVEVQFKGEMADNTEISSNVFSYPVRVCRGCLLEFPSEADSEVDGLDCNILTSTVTPTQPCRLGQDEAVDCRICKRVRPQGDTGECDPM